jgi:hypothetical protein
MLGIEKEWCMTQEGESKSKTLLNLPSIVLGIDRGTVVPRSGCFEIAVGVNSGIRKMGDEET